MKCCNCKNDFPETYFYRDKSKSTGHKPRCKKCELLYIDKSRRRKYEKEYWSDPARKEEKRKRIKSIREKNLDAFNRTQSQYRKTERYKILHRKDGSLRRARISGVSTENINFKWFKHCNRNPVTFSHSNQF